MGFTFLYIRSTESLLFFLPPLSPPPVASPPSPPLAWLLPFSMAVNPTMPRTWRMRTATRLLEMRAKVPCSSFSWTKWLSLESKFEISGEFFDRER